MKKHALTGIPQTEEHKRKRFESLGYKNRKFPPKTDKFRKDMSERLKGNKINVGRTGEKGGHWKGGVKINDNGYFLRIIDGTYKRQHRIDMEAALKRPLLSSEVIHHCDENKKNNSLENLTLFRNHSSHMRLHSFARRHGLKVEKLKFEQPWLFNS